MDLGKPPQSVHPGFPNGYPAGGVGGRGMGVTNVAFDVIKDDDAQARDTFTADIHDSQPGVHTLAGGSRVKSGRREDRIPPHNHSSNPDDDDDADFGDDDSENDYDATPTGSVHFSPVDMMPHPSRAGFWNIDPDRGDRSGMDTGTGSDVIEDESRSEGGVDTGESGPLLSSYDEGATRDPLPSRQAWGADQSSSGSSPCYNEWGGGGGGGGRDRRGEPSPLPPAHTPPAQRPPDLPINQAGTWPGGRLAKTRTRSVNAAGVGVGVGPGGPSFMPTISEDEATQRGGDWTPDVSLSRTSSYSALTTSANGHGHSSDRDSLTVEGHWKAETAMKVQQIKRSSGAGVLAVIKWIVTVVMALLLLACLVSVRLSLLLLTSQLWQNRPAGSSPAQWSRYSAHFIVLYLYLSIPPLLMLLRSIWFGLFDRTVPWPKKSSVLAALVSAACESLGLCLMVYSVLGRYETPLSSMLLTVVLLVPAFNIVWVVKGFVNEEKVRQRTLMLTVVGAMCMLLGAAGVCFIIWDTGGLNFDLWHLGLAFICLSVAWLPSLQAYITATKPPEEEPGTGDDRERSYRRQSSNPIYNTFSTDLGDVNTETLNSSAFNGTDSTAGYSYRTPATSSSSSSDSRLGSSQGHLRTNAAWTTSLVVNLGRLLFTFLFSAVIYIMDSGQDVSFVLTPQIEQAFIDSWDLASFVQDSSAFVALGLGIGAGFLAYCLAFAACHMNMANGALAPPLLLAAPVCLGIVALKPMCESFLPVDTCTWDESTLEYLVPATFCLLLGHALTFGWYLFRIDPMLLQQEILVFCVPGYNSVALDAWLTINRRCDVTESETNDKKSRKKTKVFICTTMYREEEDEMRQLLDSIRLINEAQAGGDRCFESHIIFDNGVRQRELSEFALTLISLLDETLDLEPKACTKVVTPYGLKLSWALPGPSGCRMPFNIHLKDNLLVKNKKRWSQVMYMSYVLDFLTGENDDAFILTTDADVVFTPDSVEALLDLMTRDRSIGAVCARTHPMGGGPLVWYQVFEYAIGHWFQKAAEHVLGSVLCAPGCFSVYRCRALADVLPKYARRVETAFDFLTKDMGEDRWLCTLLVQSGWRIEYCAASENRTNCPSHFDEFYKQRRRWIASTLANLMLIIKEWKYIHLLNHRVSVVFLLYQGLLLFSTLIGPSTVMLVVAGGLSFAWDINVVSAVVVQLLACIAYAVLCIVTTQTTQLKLAKMYTFLYSVVMTAVVVGTAEQIVDDLTKQDSGSGPGPNPNSTVITTTTSSPSQHISVDMPISVTTLYFAMLASIFTMAGVLHPREIFCLVHGVWYLLCLPSGYLVLTVYSVCNITDSSWGTREQASEKSSVKKVPWQQRIYEWFFEIFFCCAKKKKSTTTVDVGVQTVMPRSASVTLSEERALSPAIHEEVASHTVHMSVDGEFQYDNTDEIPDESEPLPVEEWLPVEMRGRYAQLFRKHGFDNTMLIAGMTETELRRIGISTRGHLHYLLAQITLIPAFEIEYKVPTNVDEWLEEIGLPMYRDNFRRNHIRQPKEMEILKSFGRKEIERELGIVKDGHIKRMKYAISMLRDPTEAQQKAIRMRQVIEESPIHNLAESNVEENDFWEKLKEKCLQPDLKAFGLEGEVKVKLANLRNDWLLVLAVSNTLWLILISTLASTSALTVLGANPLGLVFLIVFGFLFALQFLTMLLHRLYTTSHYLARAPYSCKRPMKNTFTFAGPERADFEETMDWAAMMQVKRDEKRARDRVMSSKRRSRRGKGSNSPTSGSASVSVSETAPLMGGAVGGGGVRE